MQLPRVPRIARFLSATAVAAFALFCIVLLVIRYIIYPRIDDYRERIVDRLSTELGQPVAMAAIETGWQGWNPRLTIRGVQVRDGSQPAAPALVDLPRVDLVVSWTSLPLLDLRFKQIRIDHPQLSVRRDAQGRLHVAGIEIDPEHQGDDTRVTEWLLRQESIVVSDALLTWSDELRRAPQLVLDHVQFRLEHSAGHHRFGLIGAPPADLASPLDFRGDVTDVSLKDWRGARGRFYVRLDFADIALWREWIPIPIAVDSGKGALRAWFDFAGGAPTGMVADFELVEVSTRLGRNLPKLDLEKVSGHLDWKRQEGTRVLAATGLTFTTHTGLSLDPADFNLTLQEGADGAITGGKLAIARLDLEPLSALAANLPLPEGWRPLLAGFAPKGSVSDGKFSWSGTDDLPDRYAVSGKLRQFGFSPSKGVPGVTGVTGTIDLDQSHGTATLDSRALAIEVPRLWNEALKFTSFAGRVTWDKRTAPLRVELSDARFAGTPLTGSASGSWTASEKGPGTLDLRASLGGGSVPEIVRYVPLVLDATVRDWLRASLRGGTASDVRVNVAGDLAEFPFRNNRNGKFLVALKVNDTTLGFLPQWPAIDGLDADLRFEGAGMTIEAVRGHSLGAALGPTRAEIPDLGAPTPMLTVTGDAAGPTSDFLRYVDESPVAGWIGHVTDGAKATGSGKLQLKLAVPLGKGGTRVAGSYQFIANELRFPGIPELERVNGKISFTDREIGTQDVAFEALGGPAKLTIANVDGAVRVAASGMADLARLRDELDWPLMGRVSGTTDWEGSLTARGESISWSVGSSLKGAVIDLPAPAGKTAADIAPLNIARREVAGRPREDVVTADYRGQVRAVALRGSAAGNVPDRVLVQLGKAGAAPAAPTLAGIAVRGQLPALDLDAWLKVYAGERPQGAAAAAAKPAPELSQVDLDVGTLEVFGRVLHDLKVTAQPGGEDWRLTMHGREVDGEATWHGPSATLPNGRVMARLTRFVPPGPGELHPVRGANDASGSAANPWPELDIVADSFLSKGRDLGKLELVAQPVGADWRIQKLSMVNPDGSINANGWWRVRGDHQQTSLDATVDVSDAGRYLSRFGYGDLVRDAPTNITGKLQWTGAPNDFDFPTLTGNFTLRSGAGRFTRIDPGIGKLLGVLSLQALPRRITLDFQDIFSEGFAFDDINGDMRIDDGLMQTENLKLVGPAASVAIKGDIDLAKETQRLAVRVQPALSSSVSAGAAVLFIANPLVGAAVGAGALLAQKLLNNPLDQMFSYEYRVTGPWADPAVERMNGKFAAVPGTAEYGGDARK
ncbi:MAG TPA: YhdP family protein [Casimicrobiaceae bacterium]|nr:YhdP family protein [Casimicrobiaceae bacterium]